MQRSRERSQTSPLMDEGMSLRKREAGLAALANREHPQHVDVLARSLRSLPPLKLREALDQLERASAVSYTEKTRDAALGLERAMLVLRHREKCDHHPSGYTYTPPGHDEGWNPASRKEFKLNVQAIQEAWGECFLEPHKRAMGSRKAAPLQHNRDRIALRASALQMLLLLRPYLTTRNDAEWHKFLELAGDVWCDFTKKQHLFWFLHAIFVYANIFMFDLEGFAFRELAVLNKNGVSLTSESLKSNDPTVWASIAEHEDPAVQERLKDLSLLTVVAQGDGQLDELVIQALVGTFRKNGTLAMSSGDRKEIVLKPKDGQISNPTLRACLAQKSQVSYNPKPAADPMSPPRYSEHKRHSGYEIHPDGEVQLKCTEIDAVEGLVMLRWLLITVEACAEPPRGPAMGYLLSSSVQPVRLLQERAADGFAAVRTTYREQSRSLVKRAREAAMREDREAELEAQSQFILLQHSYEEECRRKRRGNRP